MNKIGVSTVKLCENQIDSISGSIGLPFISCNRVMTPQHMSID